MSNVVNPPRGMRDFLPEDKAKREFLLSKIKTSYQKHGFFEIETPVVEDYDRLHSGVGGDNEKLSFAILKRGISAEDLQSAAQAEDAEQLADLGLRYDLTVPLARFYASNKTKLPGIFRSIQIAPAWRAERPQKGRFRQFIQCDIDIIGDSSIQAEAELLIAAVQTFEELGLSDFSIAINDRRILSRLLDSFGIAASDHDKALITLDKLDKVGPEGVLKELAERNFSEQIVEQVRGFLIRPMTLQYIPFGEAQIRHLLPRDFDAPEIAELAQLAELLSAAGVNPERLSYNPFLVRGMGYYTGPIFEVLHPQLGYSLGGGGRYNGMIGRFTGEETPAVGFSIGFERLLDLVDLSEAESANAVLLLNAGTSASEVLKAKSTLIAAGYKVSVQTKPKNTKAILDRAKEQGFSHWLSLEPGIVISADSPNQLS